MLLKATLPSGEKAEVSFENFVFDFDEDTSAVDFDVENVHVKIDGEDRESFGVNFAGHQYDSYEFFRGLVAAYVNNVTSIEWNEVPECLHKAGMDFFKPAVIVHGRKVPERIVDFYCENVLPLQFVSDGYSEEYRQSHPAKVLTYRGNASYSDGCDHFILLDWQGDTLTDYECFWLSGVAQTYREDNIVYGKDMLEKIVKECDLDEE